MEIVNLIQGSEEWLAFRKEHYPASEAPAMMGVGKYYPKTKEDLALVRLGVVKKEISLFQQRLFDKGHQTEEAARPIAEKITKEVFSNVTAKKIVEELNFNLSASFDGIDFNEEILFEHKMWNKNLAESIKKRDLDPYYYWQLEQQLFVSGASKVIFMTSDAKILPPGEKPEDYPYYSEQIINPETGKIYYTVANNLEYFYYTPVEGRVKALLEGWKRFEETVSKVLIDDNNWDNVAKEYLKIQDKIDKEKNNLKILNSMIEPVKDTIINFVKQSGNNLMVGSGIEVKKTKRKGLINNKQIFIAMAKKAGLIEKENDYNEDALMKYLGVKSIDDFRKPSTESWSVSKVKREVDNQKVIKLASKTKKNNYDKKVN